MTLPSVVIVGRPNVGKSTLLNFLAGRRISIVHDAPGVTRDRIAAEVALDTGSVIMVDTGGIGVVDRQDLSSEIEEQIARAIADATLILFVVDGKEGLHALDYDVAKRLREQPRPVLLVANKCESEAARQGLGEFFKLGCGEPFPVSAVHNINISALRERITQMIVPATAPVDAALKFAIVGRRNAGKSTFINALLREERVIVSAVPGTTRDAIDVRFQKDGLEFIAIDTAGLVRTAKVRDSIEFYAQTRTREAIRRCDVAIFMIDAAHGVSQLDKRIASDLCESYRPCVIAVNKWDLVGEKVSTSDFSEYLVKAMPGLDFAPCVFLTAKENKNVWDVISVAQSLAKQAAVRVTTGELNRVIEKAVKGPMPQASHGMFPKIFYATQVDIRPPTIVLMVNEPDHFGASYRRSIERRMRKELRFEEIPLKLVYRRRAGGDSKHEE